MSTYAEPRSHAGSNTLIVLGVVAALFLCAAASSVPMDEMSSAVPSAHAVERHGSEAVIALDMIQRNGDCRECLDGRKRCTASEHGQWAVVVYEMIQGKWMPLTSFLTTQDYANSVKDNCNKQWRLVHP